MPAARLANHVQRLPRGHEAIVGQEKEPVLHRLDGHTVAKCLAQASSLRRQTLLREMAVRTRGKKRQNQGPSHVSYPPPDDCAVTYTATT